MTRSGHTAPLLLLTCALSFAVATACTDPTQTEVAASAVDETAGPPENCAASAEWLPRTPPLAQFEPLAHPETECPFYRGAWQSFLVATQPDASGEPALRAYPTVDDLFVSKTPHGVRNTAERAWLGDIKQAGGRQILVDQNGRSIYYGIHTNQAFADFVTENGLTTAEGIKNASPSLFFPAGVVELKSAWQDIEGLPTSSYDGYITTTAWVPHLSQDATTHRIIEDKNKPRLIKVALLALHVVFTLPGHPEFIWATFEHIDGSGGIDNAPAATVNPTLTDPYNLKDTSVVCPAKFPLCKEGTSVNRGNQPVAETDLRLDEASQAFPGQETSIYRMYPGSKSNGVDADEAVASLNANMRALFVQKASELTPRDKRASYKLIGATWMDKPALFRIDSSFQNDPASALLQNANRPT